ncbi:hypothetical protein ES708_24409 [subsurface metagenome]
MDHKFNPSLFEAIGPLRAMSLRFALVQYGAGVIQMSGSIAGDVHARNRFGNYIRPRTKPVNPHSERQESARATVSMLAEYWHSGLSPGQRGLWGTYAAAIAMKNRLGATIHLTGFNHFIRSNAAMIASRGTLQIEGPQVLSLPAKDNVLQCTDEGINGQNFTFVCDKSGWEEAEDEKKYISIYQGQPQLISRNFFAGPWRFMDHIDATQGAAGTATLNAPFAFALNQKVWFQARVITKYHRVSELWTLNPRVIEKDPDA